MCNMIEMKFDGFSLPPLVKGGVHLIVGATAVGVSTLIRQMLIAAADAEGKDKCRLYDLESYPEIAMAKLYGMENDVPFVQVMQGDREMPWEEWAPVVAADGFQYEDYDEIVLPRVCAIDALNQIYSDLRRQAELVRRLKKLAMRDGSTLLLGLHALPGQVLPLQMEHSSDVLIELRRMRVFDFNGTSCFVIKNRYGSTSALRLKAHNFRFIGQDDVPADALREECDGE